MKAMLNKQCFVVTCGQSKCSGHGDCLTMNEAYQLAYAGQASLPGPFSGWEGDHVTMCVCEIGYSGSECQYSKFNIHQLYNNGKY